MDKKYEYPSRKTKPPLPHTLCLGTCHASLRSEGRRHLIVLSFHFLFQVLKKKPITHSTGVARSPALRRLVN